MEAFRLLRERGICPMPMMMHHDAQPLLSLRGHYGLLNQVRLLRKAGAISLQVLMITPATGSRLYEPTFESGMVYESVAGRHPCSADKSPRLRAVQPSAGPGCAL